jgi:hypothetical protein
LNKFSGHLVNGEFKSIIDLSSDISSSSRDATHAAVSIIGKFATDGNFIHRSSSLITGLIYPVTDSVGLIKVSTDIFQNHTAVLNSFNLMNSVPDSIEESLDAMTGRVYWLGFIRTITGAVAWLGGKFDAVAPLGDAAAALRNAALHKVATVSKELYDSAFSLSLTVPFANGISRWGYAKYADDSTATVLAQATTTALFLVLKYNPKMLALDLAFNVAINHEAYWNGTKNIASGAVNIAYEVKDGLCNVANYAYSIMGASNSDEEL